MELFDKLSQLSADELIALSKASEEDSEGEDFEHPLTAHETAMYFQAKGTLTAEEFNALLKNRLSEIFEEAADSDI